MCAKDKVLYMNNYDCIKNGHAILGIELGSTRIKGVLTNHKHEVIASGNYEWENKLIDGIWTYSMDEVWTGLQECYCNLLADVKSKFNTEITNLEAIGISGMMHGYLPFDKDDELLVPFRTWRNTITEEASRELTKQFDFPIPQRWSIAHLYQAMLNDEAHVKEVAFITTLAGYVHWKLTGRKIVGIGEASGMFPIDKHTKDWNQDMLNQFNKISSQYGCAWEIKSILPEVMVAGQNAGSLTEEGARLLDVTGSLKSGIAMCPPEGDAGTGMVATNSVKVRTGNVSAGTSIFGMIVLEEELKRVHEEIDLVTTPSGELVAMVHCNNGTSDLNAWVNLFKEFADCMGIEVDMGHVYGTLYRKALEGDKECSGLMAYNYLSGEHGTGFEKGCPLFVRSPKSKFDLANFMRTHIYTSMGALKAGMNILIQEEGVKLEEIYGHGGFFKTKGVGQAMMAAALDTPVIVMETAGEGGAWGIAVLAGYMVLNDCGMTLEQYLNKKVFASKVGERLTPEQEDVKGFEKFMERYISNLQIERAAVDCLD